MVPGALECQSRIREAATDEEVVRLVREFFAGIPAEIMSTLPPDCVPRSLDNRESIMALNLHLARTELLSPASAPYATTLRMILSVTTQAATRFAQLSADGLLRPRPDAG